MDAAFSSLVFFSSGEVVSASQLSRSVGRSVGRAGGKSGKQEKLLVRVMFRVVFLFFAGPSKRVTEFCFFTV